MAEKHSALGFVESYEIVKILTLTSKLLKEALGKETLPGSLIEIDQGAVAASVSVLNFDLESLKLGTSWACKNWKSKITILSFLGMVCCIFSALGLSFWICVSISIVIFCIVCHSGLGNA